MDRRVVVLGAFAGVIAMVAAWVVLGNGEGRRGRERQQRVALNAPVRIDAQNLEKVRPGAKLRPDVMEKLRPGVVVTPVEPEWPEEAPPGAYTLDQAGIASAMDAKRADLRGCFDAAKLHVPTLSPNLTASLALVPEPAGDVGGVQGVHVEADLDASVFEGCVVTALKDTRFALREPTTVRYPFAFDEGKP